MRCEEVREMLPAAVRNRHMTLAVRRHLSQCPECQRELARYEELAASLDSLRNHTAVVPAHVTQAIVNIPESQGVVENIRSHVVRNRRAYLGGAAVALTGATTALLWRSRARRLATA
jgi:anti-sigma factor RsiW